MAKKHGSKKRQTEQPVQPQKPQGRTRKVFTVVICVVVALGLMLPVTGIGVASCASSNTQSPPQQGQSELPIDSFAPADTV